MKKPILALILFFLAVLPAWGQSTTVTLNVTDAGSQAWSNGTLQFQLVGDPQYPNLSTYTWTGGTLPLFINGSLNGSGSASVSVPSNSAITPGTSKWAVQVCPQATAKCYLGTPVVITGATQTVNLTPPAISITISNPPVNLISAYADAEITSTPLGASYFNLTSSVTRTCTAVTGTTCNTWANSGGASSGVSSVTASAPLASSGGATPNITAGTLPNAPSPSSGYTFFLSSTSNCLSPSSSGTTVCAMNNLTSAIDFSGTDAAVVIGSSITNISATCGTLYFKSGDYKFNSMTLETTGGYSNLYYAVAVPANAGSANQYCQWSFIGEEGTQTNISGAAQGQGVIFDVTAAARTSCGTGHWCVAWWHRPDRTNNVGNDVVFKNITTRFPDNQRGNEAAYLMWEAVTVNFDTVYASLNTTIGNPPTISPAVAGSNHMIGFSSTMSSRNNWQYFTRTWAIGYDIGYDIESEHSILDAATAFANNTGFYYCRLNTFGTFTNSNFCFHPSTWKKITDQENINGIAIGSNMAQGSLLNIDGLDIEYLNSGSFSRVNNITEANNGYTSGTISYTYVLAGSGIVGELPSGILFNSGGANFTVREGTTSPNGAKQSVTDAFTRPNTTVSNTGLGPAWQSNLTGNVQCGILSNAAVTSTTATQACAVSYAAQPTASDQFSVITVGTPTSTGQTNAIVRASSTLNTQTFYEYDCSTSGGQIAKRRIAKDVAGVFTSLVTTSSNSGCSAGDKMELWAVGTTLIGFYTPSGGARTIDLITTDSSITSGQPGIYVYNNANAASPTISNFNGGSLVPGTSLASIFNQAMFAPTYNTLSNCSAVGTAASPSVASCGSAAAGQFSCATNATGATCQVNTTAVTANSEIFVFESDDTTTGTRLGVTCNTGTTVNPTTRLLASTVTGTSFTINLGTVTTNPACFSYHIIN